MGANCCSEAETNSERLAYQQHQDVNSLLREMQRYKDSTEGYHDVKKMRKSLQRRNETKTKIERFQQRMSLRPDHLHPIAILRENEGLGNYYHSASPTQNNNEDISDTSEDHEMTKKNRKSKHDSGRRKPLNKGSNVKILCGNKNFAVLDKHDGKGPVVKWYN